MYFSSPPTIVHLSSRMPTEKCGLKVCMKTNLGKKQIFQMQKLFNNKQANFKVKCHLGISTASLIPMYELAYRTKNNQWHLWKRFC